MATKRQRESAVEESPVSEAAAKSLPERPDPRAGSFAERLARGFGYPFSTLLYMLRRPVLWSYTFLPVLVTACALVLILYGLVSFGPALTNWIWTPGEEWYWMLLWYPLHVLVLVLLFAIGAVTLPGLVSSPFIKALSRRTEELETQERARKERGRPFFRELLSTFLDALIRIAFLLAVHAVLLVIVIIPVAGQIIYPVAAWLWTVFWLSAQNIGFPLSRRKQPFMEGPRTVRRNLALFLGFGAAVFLFLLMPLFNFLFVPVAVVAATRLFLDLESNGAIPSPPPATAKE